MMIMKYLLDREEVYENEEWYIVELLTVKCPECNRDTDMIYTYPDYSEYHHSPVDFCTVVWTNEFLDAEPGSVLMVVPGYIRD